MVEKLDNELRTLYDFAAIVSISITYASGAWYLLYATVESQILALTAAFIAGAAMPPFLYRHLAMKERNDYYDSKKIRLPGKKW